MIHQVVPKGLAQILELLNFGRISTSLKGETLEWMKLKSLDK